MSPRYTDLCSVADLGEDAVIEVSVRGRRLAVVRSHGEVSVFMAACPHRGGPIGRGRLACRVLSEGPGAPCVDEEQVLLCPWHGWEFSLRDGRALADPKVQLRAFPAEVRDGRVMARL